MQATAAPDPTRTFLIELLFNVPADLARVIAIREQVMISPLDRIDGRSQITLETIRGNFQVSAKAGQYVGALRVGQHGARPISDTLGPIGQPLQA
jgi:hypothetical protein